MTARKVADFASIHSILTRVTHDEVAGAEVLRRLVGSVSLSDPAVVGDVASHLSRAANPDLRRQLIMWLSLAPLDMVENNLLTISTQADLPDERKYAATTLLAVDPAAAPRNFRILWSNEHDDGVRCALVRALGSMRSLAILDELQRAYETGSDSVKAAVHDEVDAHLRACDCSAGQRLLHYIDSER